MTTRFSPTRLKVLGSGTALPGPAVSNEELVSHLRARCGTEAANRALKYARRLGIQSRHVSRDLTQTLSGCREGSTAPDLCSRALESAAAPTELSFLIGHTSTPHTLLPGNTAWVADQIGHRGPYLDLRQACTGFAGALSIAAAMLAEDSESVIGIVGSETGSPFFNLSAEFVDREQLINYVQMGDGAGALVLTADDGSGAGTVSDIYFGHMGLGMQPGISISGGGSANPACDQGLPYFRHRAVDVRKRGEALINKGMEAIGERGFSLRDFDWIIPHQANGLIAELFAERFPEARGKVVVTADRLGNLGSAAIWVGLDRLRRSADLHAGQRVLVLGAEASKYLYGGFVYTH